MRVSFCDADTSSYACIDVCAVYTSSARPLVPESEDGRQVMVHCVPGDGETYVFRSGEIDECDVNEELERIRKGAESGLVLLDGNLYFMTLRPGYAPDTF